MFKGADLIQLAGAKVAYNNAVLLFIEVCLNKSS